MQLNDYRRLYEAVTNAAGSSTAQRALSASQGLEPELAEQAVMHIFEGTMPPRVFGVSVAEYSDIYNYDTGKPISRPGVLLDCDVAEAKETFGELFQPWSSYDVEVFGFDGANPWPARLAAVNAGKWSEWAPTIRAKAPKQPLKLTLDRADNVIGFEVRDQNGVLYLSIPGAIGDYDLYRAAVSAAEAFEATINNPAPEDPTLFNTPEGPITRRQGFEQGLDVTKLEPLPEREYELITNLGRQIVRLQSPAQVQLPEGTTRYQLVPKVEYRFGAYYFAGTNERANLEPNEWIDVVAA